MSLIDFNGGRFDIQLQVLKQLGNLMGVYYYCSSGNYLRNLHYPFCPQALCLLLFFSIACPPCFNLNWTWTWITYVFKLVAVSCVAQLGSCMTWAFKLSVMSLMLLPVVREEDSVCCSFAYNLWLFLQCLSWSQPEVTIMLLVVECWLNEILVVWPVGDLHTVAGWTIDFPEGNYY